MFTSLIYNVCVFYFFFLYISQRLTRAVHPDTVPAKKKTITVLGTTTQDFVMVMPLGDVAFLPAAQVRGMISHFISIFLFHPKTNYITARCSSSPELP